VRDVTAGAAAELASDVGIDDVIGIDITDEDEVGSEGFDDEGKLPTAAAADDDDLDETPAVDPTVVVGGAEMPKLPPTMFAELVVLPNKDRLWVGGRMFVGGGGCCKDCCSCCCCDDVRPR